MFTLPKSNFPIYFQAYASNVVEQVGDIIDNVSYFSDLPSAKIAATEKQVEQIERDLYFLRNITDNGNWLAFWVRGLFNKDSMKALKKHTNNIANLEKELQQPVNLTVKLLPTMLKFTGELLHIGTKIYRVGPSHTKIVTSEITGYAAYGKDINGDDKLTFENTKHFIINSNSFKNGKCFTNGYKLFLDKQEAEIALKETIKEQIKQLNDEFKQLEK